MREATQLRIILELLDTYKGKEPLSRFLKKYFNLNRQLGSRDRKLIQQFIYNYFRIGRMYPEKPVQERLAIANKACRADTSPLLDYSFRELKNIDRAATHLEPDKIFPFGRHLSDSIDKAEFIHSFLVQPRVWIRVRTEFIPQVEKELTEKEIVFEKDVETGNAWSVKNSTALDQLESFSKGYFEIQDLSSQKTIQLVQPKQGESWWDACAGAGGKGLMMTAFEPSVKIFCTDTRETILKNLVERFQKAGFKNYTAKVLDLTADRKPVLSNHFDGIITDVPCSGSGTWSRTPEWLTYFDQKSISKYQQIQRKIVSSVIRFLPENKPLVYITCSVFKEENEDNTGWITENLPLKLQTQMYLEGVSKGADTMFVARFLRI
ncbi:MAG: RsmB/NOP family class I SAM-dependent RNA methyltransferase [Bacteroidota bacterium]